jgi:hypothetical protein
MDNILLHSGISLLEAHRVAKAAGMYLVTDGRTVVVSPLILPGWREVPLFLRGPRQAANAPDHNADLLDMVAA